MRDRLKTVKEIEADGKLYSVYSLRKLEQILETDIGKLPFSVKILLENALRNCDGKTVCEEHVRSLANWDGGKSGREIPYKPARVILQDFTGVPCVADLASMRSAVSGIDGADCSRINPVVPVDLVIDHSIQVDFFSGKDSFSRNVELEYQRNSERYKFLKWAQKSFDNFRVVPPGTGIVHQVNLERLATVVAFSEKNGRTFAYPDTLVGTDSHTTMINGLSVLGWGVGGIEAEACMLGQPLYMLMPEVTGFKINGKLREGTTATDLVLTITEMLRKKGVVGKFVEFYGDGISKLSLSDRATIANMAPEYGATMGFFPTDSETLRYIASTGRGGSELIETYATEQMLFRRQGEYPRYTDTLELDIGTVEPSVAGPDRPQDRVSLKDLKRSYEKSLKEKTDRPGAGNARIEINGDVCDIENGSVVIAAITSCTNTSNPSVMVAAGLLARKAVEKGLRVKPYVKTSLAPGSRVVTDYLSAAGLMEPLEALGFNLVGYGCTTCIGNSGPLPEEVEKGIKEGNLTCASVLSGNRNFQGRIHPLVKFSYLASPPLVVAFALAGTVNKDVLVSPIGKDGNGGDVYLKDIWPAQDEINKTVSEAVSPEMFKRQYSGVFEGDRLWSELSAPRSVLYDWDETSTYIQNPPFFENFSLKRKNGNGSGKIEGARALAVLGDSVTTDHISPAGFIQSDGPAGRYLVSKSVEQKNFNSFGARRGNHEVMMRGTFANIRIKNLMVPQTEGGWTVHIPSGKKMAIYDAAEKYMREGTPLVVLAGKEYGTGSSRDWAAKGTALLGVKCVIAESYERIHRSNLVGMGVLPLQFNGGENARNLSLTGFETFSLIGLPEKISPGAQVRVKVETGNGTAEEKFFTATCRLDSPVEVEYYKNGGILQTVLRQMVG